MRFGVLGVRAALGPWRHHLVLAKVNTVCRGSSVVKHVLREREREREIVCVCVFYARLCPWN